MTIESMKPYPAYKDNTYFITTYSIYDEAKLLGQKTRGYATKS